MKIGSRSLRDNTHDIPKGVRTTVPIQHLRGARDRAERELAGPPGFRDDVEQRVRPQHTRTIGKEAQIDDADLGIARASRGIGALW